MSTGLLDFLGIENQKLDWKNELNKCLKLHHIICHDTTGHIEFNVEFLVFDIWFDGKYYIVSLEKTKFPSNRLLIPVDILFGLIKPNKDFMKFKNKTIKDFIEFVENMIYITKSIKESKYYMNLIDKNREK